MKRDNSNPPPPKLNLFLQPAPKISLEAKFRGWRQKKSAQAKTDRADKLENKKLGILGLEPRTSCV